jgi:hypothetical protein
LAQPRVHLRIVQALLGLLVLVWLPAAGFADTRDLLPDRFSDPLALWDGAGQGDAEGEVFADDRSDAGDGSGDSALLNLPIAPVLCDVPWEAGWDIREPAFSRLRQGARHATGPPRL